MNAGAGAVVEETASAGERPKAGLLRGLIKEARPKQWVKNVLVVAAPAAGGKLFAGLTPGRTALMFVLFSVTASGIYYLNDAIDVQADRAHPVKRLRPIAAGVIPLPPAYAIGGILVVVGVAGAGLLLNLATLALTATYAVVQILYCLWLKHVGVMDIAVVASGFLMRAIAGGLATGVSPSKWFLITTGFGSLFVVAAKRSSELQRMGDDAEKTRKLLGEYTPSYLRFVWQGSAIAMMLAYCLWAMDPTVPHDSVWRTISILPISLAVLRYALLVDRGEGGAPEDVLLKDRPILAFGALWLVTYGTAIVVPH